MTLKNSDPENNKELVWSDKERDELESRITNLRTDQIAALLNLVGLGFHREDIEDVASEIKEEKRQSIHFLILITEADSKENLLWWINYFENKNRAARSQP